MAAFLRTVLKRVLVALGLIFGAITVTFFMMRLVGGDPAYLIAGTFASEEVIENIQEQLGTNKPIGTQYKEYLVGLAQFDLGTSFFTGNPVSVDLIRRTPATLTIVGIALFFSLLFGSLLGSLAAVRQYRGTDRVVRITSYIQLSLVDFWLALMLIYLLFFQLGLAPAPIGQSGIGQVKPPSVVGVAIWDALIARDSKVFLDAAAHAALPVLTMTLIYTGPITSLVRSKVIETLGSDYIKFARACGLAARTVWLYALRAAMVPVVTFAGLIFSLSLGGACW